MYQQTQRDICSYKYKNKKIVYIMDKKQFFKIKPTKEKQVICKELWENVLKNKKKVIFSLETVYNTGEFKLHINKSEYEKIKNKLEKHFSENPFK